MAEDDADHPVGIDGLRVGPGDVIPDDLLDVVLMLVESHGYLEVRRHLGNWQGVLNVREILGPDDGQAARTLFLPDWPLGFLPAFHDRGLPSDVSPETNSEWLTWHEANPLTRPSWATLAEIRRVAWDELSSGFSDEPPSRFRVNPHAGSDSSFWNFDGYATEQETLGREHLATWQENGFAYLRPRKTRRAVFDERRDWRALLETLEALDDRGQPDRIRLVMWFSSR